MKSNRTYKLLIEFSDRSSAATAAGDHAGAAAWTAAWELLHEAQHHSNLEVIRAATARKLAKIRNRKASV